MANRLGRVTGPPSEAAYRTLRDRIVTCELPPGQWLTERRSAVELGLGLPPVRDALVRLVQDGLVQVMPRRGYRITPLTPKSVKDLFTAWALLGPEIARLGISRVDSEQATELGRLMAAANGVLAGQRDRDGVLRYIDIAEQTFGLLTAASGNERLREVYRSLKGEMRRVGTLILTRVDSVEELLDATAMWEPAIGRRDAPAATRMARDFIEASHTAAMRVLPGWPTSGDGVVIPLRR